MTRDNHHHKDHSKRRRAPQIFSRDWRVWTVICLMLLGMVVYVMSMDEVIQPTSDPQPPVQQYIR